MLKIPPIFLKKIYKNQFLASLRGLMVFIYEYKVIYFQFWNIFEIIHHNARTTLKATFEIFLQIFLTKVSKGSFREVLAFKSKITNVFQI